MLRIVTANRLGDGRVVFLTAAGDWSGDIAAAWLLRDSGMVRRGEAIAAAAVAGCHIVEPCAIPVTEEAGGPRPVRYRERIRASGPSVPFGPATAGLPEDV